jgi:type I restriction enzyme M protein
MISTKFATCITHGKLVKTTKIKKVLFNADLADIQKHDYVLTPGRYVGAEEVEDDGEAFADKMARLTAQLKAQFEESDRLEAEIKKNLAGLGYEF